jgi:hypothetical protein
VYKPRLRSTKPCSATCLASQFLTDTRLSCQARHHQQSFQLFLQATRKGVQVVPTPFTPFRLGPHLATLCYSLPVQVVPTPSTQFRLGPHLATLCIQLATDFTQFRLCPHLVTVQVVPTPCHAAQNGLTRLATWQIFSRQTPATIKHSPGRVPGTLYCQLHISGTPCCQSHITGRLYLWLHTVLSVQVTILLEQRPLIKQQVSQQK